MRRPIVSKSERSGTEVDMANLSKAVCHGESDKCRFGNPPQGSNFQRLGITVYLTENFRTSCKGIQALCADILHASVTPKKVPGYDLFRRRRKLTPVIL